MKKQLYIPPRIKVHTLNLSKLMQMPTMSGGGGTVNNANKDIGEVDAKSSSCNFLEFGFDDSSDANNTGWSNDY